MTSTHRLRPCDRSVGRTPTDVDRRRHGAEPVTDPADTHGEPLTRVGAVAECDEECAPTVSERLRMNGREQRPRPEADALTPATDDVCAFGGGGARPAHGAGRCAV